MEKLKTTKGKVPVLPTIGWDRIYYRVLVSPPFKRLFNGPLRSLLGRLCICANVWALFTNKLLFEGLIGKLHCFAANLYKIGFTRFVLIFGPAICAQTMFTFFPCLLSFSIWIG